MDAFLQIKLLGAFQAYFHGSQLDGFDSDKVRGLLIYLSMETERPHSREKLAGLLWPDYPNRSARTSLRRALTNLRTVISDRNIDPPFLLVSRQTIQFNTASACEVDVVRFLEAIVGPADAEDLEGALSLYKGPFLEGFSLPDCSAFEEWILVTRENLQKKYFDALRRLSNEYAAKEDLEAALEPARKLVDSDPFNEPARRWLMRLLASCGHQAEAVGQYEALCDLLQRELATIPAEETQRLYELIRSGEFSDLPGRRPEGNLRGYDLQQRIGGGSYGIVYKARQPAISRSVAIKMILPEHANKPDFIRRFEAEAQIVAQLEHPYILPLYDFWREPDGAYLVMRLMPGSLEDLLAARNLEKSEIASILDQICSALKLAHHRGVVHRDLKPANILLDDDGNAYLSDFGIATEVHEDRGTKQPDAILGSSGYMSPEQLRGQPVSPRTDIYALGVLLFELFTRKHPSKDVSFGELMLKMPSEPLPPVAEFLTNAPAGLEDVIQRATAIQSEERYPDIIAFQAAYRAFLVEPGTKVVTEPDLVVELINPYKGLRAFQESDALNFFGRENLTARLLARMLEEGPYNRFLAVVGPSGSGKSSLVKAGLLPALRSGSLPGSDQWFIAEMMPGKRPFDELGRRLEQISANRRAGLAKELQKDKNSLARTVRLCLPSDEDTLLLVIDQFEEFFTLATDPQQVALFLGSLHSAIEESRGRLRVIITLRADFYDQPLMHPDFSKLVQARTEVVVPLTTEELTRAIQAPTERMGAHLENGLVTRIASDVNEQPGALPLLQYALTELFEHREDRQLTFAAYQEIGGVLGALGKRAESVFQAQSSEDQELARQIFLRLVTLGEGVEDTRRRVLKTELMALSSEARVQHVLDTYGRYRLLTFDLDPATRIPTVEVAHEALLREWLRLRDWLDESRADVRMQRVLYQLAREWAQSMQDPSFLLHGARLDQFFGWSEETDIVLTVGERIFLDESLEEKRRRDAEEEARQERERALEQRSRNFLRALVGVFALAAVVAVVLSIFAFTQQGIAEEQRDIAEQEARAALEAYSLSLTGHAQNALDEGDTGTALLLALAATRHNEPLAEAMRVLRTAAYAPGMREQLLVEELFPGVESQIYSLTASPVANQFLFGFFDGTLILWDLDERSVIHHLEGHSGVVRDVAFSPDGREALSGGDDHAVIHWDLETGDEIQRLEGHRGWIFAVAFSPDGRIAASGGLAGDSLLAFSEPGQLFVWDLEHGAVIHQIQRSEGPMALGIKDLAFTPDNQSIVVSNGVFTASSTDFRLVVLDATSAEEMITWETQQDNFSIAISPDGRQMLTASSDNALHIWDLQNGEEVGTLDGHPNLVTSVAFSPDGTRILSADWNGRVFLRDTQEYTQIMHVRGHQVNWPWIGTNYSPVTAVLSADARQALSVAGDGTVVIWDLTYAGDEQHFAGPEEAWLVGVTFSTDGRHAFTGSGLFFDVAGDNTIKMWNLETGLLERVFEGHTHAVLPLALNEDGSRLLSGSIDGTIRLWDVATGRELRSMQAHPHGVFAVDITPDGKRAVSGPAAGGDALIIWDLETGKALHRIPLGDENITYLEIAPDGKAAFSETEASTLGLIDLETGQWIRRYSTTAGFDTEFSPDRKKVFIVDGEDVLEWDLETDSMVKLFGKIPSARSQVEITPDGRLLLTSNNVGDLFLWDVESGQELYRFHSDVEQFLMYLDIHPDGRYALSPAGNNSAILWDLTLPIDLEGVRAWIAENRFLREPTCNERQVFSLLPLCDQDVE